MENEKVEQKCGHSGHSILFTHKLAKFLLKERTLHVQSSWFDRPTERSCQPMEASNKSKNDISRIETKEQKRLFSLT